MKVTEKALFSVLTGRIRWFVAAGLIVFAASLLVELLSVSPARGQVTGTDRSDGILAIAGQVTTNTYGIYLVDLNNGTICVYRYMPDTRKLKLAAGRMFTFDLQLDEYNTEPSPREIKEIVGKQKRLDRTRKN